MESLAAAEVKPHNSSMMCWNGLGLESSAQVGGRRVTTPLTAGLLQVAATHGASVSKGGENGCSRLGG
jgi:hypothetical protein